MTNNNNEGRFQSNFSDHLGIEGIIEQSLTL